MSHVACNAVAEAVRALETCSLEARSSAVSGLYGSDQAQAQAELTREQQAVTSMVEWLMVRMLMPTLMMSHCTSSVFVVWSTCSERYARDCGRQLPQPTT